MKSLYSNSSRWNSSELANAQDSGHDTYCTYLRGIKTLKGYTNKSSTWGSWLPDKSNNEEHCLNNPSVSFTHCHCVYWKLGHAYPRIGHWANKKTGFKHGRWFIATNITPNPWGHPQSSPGFSTKVTGRIRHELCWTPRVISGDAQGFDVSAAPKCRCDGVMPVIQVGVSKAILNYRYIFVINPSEATELNQLS